MAQSHSRSRSVPGVITVLAGVDGRAVVAGHADLAGEVAERIVLEDSRVELIDRLRAGIGQPIWISVGLGCVTGELTEVVSDAVVTCGERGKIIVALSAVAAVSAAPARAVSPSSVSRIDARLGIGSLLRRETGRGLTLATRAGDRFSGTLVRVGADHLQLLLTDECGGRRRTSLLVPFDAVSTIAID